LGITADLRRPGAAAAPPVKIMNIAIGGDHAGFPLKGPVIDFLRGLGHTVEDCGSYDPSPVDFPDISRGVCSRVRSGSADRGILV